MCACENAGANDFEKFFVGVVFSLGRRILIGFFFFFFFFFFFLMFIWKLVGNVAQCKSFYLV